MRFAVTCKVQEEGILVGGNNQQFQICGQLSETGRLRVNHWFINPEVIGGLYIGSFDYMMCMHACMCVCVCVSVCSQSCLTLQPYGQQPTNFLCPWDFPGKNTGVGCHFFLQEFSSIQGWNPHLLHLLHWQAGSLSLSYLGRLIIWQG